MVALAMIDELSPKQDIYIIYSDSGNIQERWLKKKDYKNQMIERRAEKKTHYFLSVAQNS